MLLEIQRKNEDMDHTQNFNKHLLVWMRLLVERHIVIDFLLYHYMNDFLTDKF